jgi:hypothetical protein
VQATRQLSLSFAESTALINMIMEEQIKIREYEATLNRPEYASRFDLKWLDEIHRPIFIFDELSGLDIRHGRAFLSFLGLHDTAENISYYHGVTSQLYWIELNHYPQDGPQGLFPHFNVACAREIATLAAALRREQALRPRAMSAGELLVRMDAPPGTANPRRLVLDNHQGDRVVAGPSSAPAQPPRQEFRELMAQMAQTFARGTNQHNATGSSNRGDAKENTAGLGRDVDRNLPLASAAEITSRNTSSGSSVAQNQNSVPLLDKGKGRADPEP